MAESSRAYVPAAGNHWSLPLYDPVVRLIGADAARRDATSHLFRGGNVPP